MAAAAAAVSGGSSAGPCNWLFSDSETSGSQREGVAHLLNCRWTEACYTFSEGRDQNPGMAAAYSWTVLMVRLTFRASRTAEL